MRRVKVWSVSVPAMSTIGTGKGFDVETGETVTFHGDHRPMRDLGEALEEAEDDAFLPEVELEDWQIASVSK